MSNKRKRDEDGGAPAWKKQAKRDGQRGMSINKILSRHQRYDNREVKQKQFYERAKKLRAFHTLIKREERERQVHGESVRRNVYEEEEERKRMEKELHLDMEDAEEEKKEEDEDEDEDEEEEEEKNDEIQSHAPSNTNKNTNKNKTKTNTNTNTNTKQKSQPFHHPDRQPKPPKPTKMTPEMRAAERERAEKEYQERQQRLAASKRERSAKHKLANVKTRKGQPIMATRMEALLTRLQATIPSPSSNTTSAKQR